jgi:hypothetical protein
MRQYFWGMYLCVLLTTAGALGQTANASLLVVSQPPRPVLQTDLLQGQIYEVPLDLSTARVRVQGQGGPVNFDYLRLSETGTGFISVDDGAEGGGLLVIDNVLSVQGPLDTSQVPSIQGTHVALSAPKGITVDETAGLVITADFDLKTVKGFPLNATSNRAPEFSILDLGLASSSGVERQPWGLDVDEEQQRLFVAATDGTVLVYDDYLSQGQAGPDRIIIPSINGQKVSANLHGILYLPESDRLVVTDFGPGRTSDQPGFDSDGKVFVLDEASSASGFYNVTLQLSGASALLGNPSDVVVDGDTLYVSEKALDLVLRFDDVLDQSGTLELFPNAAVSVPKPESMVLLNP